MRVETAPIPAFRPACAGLPGLAAAALLALCLAPPGSAAREPDGWRDLPKVLARIRPPAFPQRDYPITRFGATPGADATVALGRAIAACSRDGGGRVVVPPGRWPTGAVRLRSNVDLHLEEGATLAFSTRPGDYPLVGTRFEGVECTGFSPLIYASGEENIAVTGAGVLDGGASGGNWWAWAEGAGRRDQADRRALFGMGEAGVPPGQRVFGPGHFLRPSFIEFVRCRNAEVQGVSIVRSPMWEIHPVLCENVSVLGVRISSHGPNNDGCDPESCRDVLIDGCVFDTGDDCVAIKSGRNADGRRVGVPSENIVIRGCTMRDGHGGVTIGSEISGGCRNVFVEGCTMDSPHLSKAFRIKSNAARGGVVENVYARGVTIGSVEDAVLSIELLYEEGASGAFPPVVRNIFMSGVTSGGSRRVLRIESFRGATVDAVSVSGCRFRGVSEPDIVVGEARVDLADNVVEHVRPPLPQGPHGT